jgi:hypothetical protein
MGWGPSRLLASVLGSNRGEVTSFMARGGKAKANLTRVLAVTLLVLFLAFLVEASAHSHESGQSDATCQVCQAAHLGSVVPSGILPVHGPLQSIGSVSTFVVVFHQEFYLHDSPSRAPPSPAI